MMGRDPAWVRAQTMADLEACHRGWLRGQGIDPDEKQRPTLDDLEDLMERYPDQPASIH
jgi:hypothetical protein